jgi:hypothetical protein
VTQQNDWLNKEIQERTTELMASRKEKVSLTCFALLVIELSMMFILLTPVGSIESTAKCGLLIIPLIYGTVLINRAKCSPLSVLLF